MARLRDHAANITSQNGEDGMIEKLIADLGLLTGLCVEFGAWDGSHLSNTWNLWANYSWRAVLIEADSHRYDLLTRRTRPYSQVVPVHAMVGTTPNTSLDSVLSNTAIDLSEVDLLSIDIDGDDYFVWECSTIQPLIVVIEYNASFPPEISWVPQPGSHTGASASAFVSMARTKGYELVDMTMTNLLFVRRDALDRLTVDRPPLTELFDRSWVPLVYSDMYGIHHLVRPAQWGFAGIRADIGWMRLRGRLRHFAVTLAKRTYSANVPLVTRLLGALAHWHARRS